MPTPPANRKVLHYFGYFYPILFIALGAAGLIAAPFGRTLEGSLVVGLLGAAVFAIFPGDGRIRLLAFGQQVADPFEQVANDIAVLDIVQRTNGPLLPETRHVHTQSLLRNG